jgi:hypothetical protein
VGGGKRAVFGERTSELYQDACWRFPDGIEEFDGGLKQLNAAVGITPRKGSAPCGTELVGCSRRERGNLVAGVAKFLPVTVGAFEVMPHELVVLETADLQPASKSFVKVGAEGF